MSISFNGEKKHLNGHIRLLTHLIRSRAAESGFFIEQLDINLISDEELLAINKSALQHDYYTDIITFDYTEGKNLEGEIYISYDRVKENAKTFDSKFHVELFRVVYHGLLHLIGFKDKTKKEAEEMRKQENMMIERHLKLVPRGTQIK